MNWNYYRKFGAEIELNAFDLRNKPLNEGSYPEGIQYVGNLVQKITNEKVTIHRYGQDHHNDAWVIKPDGSCGLEVCTPVYKGLYSIKKVTSVTDAFNNDERILADNRCSLHIHVDVSDLNYEQIAAILTWWIKCEMVFLDAMPSSRKRNRYCQVIGQSDFFDFTGLNLMSSETLIFNLGSCKYFTLNCYHLYNRRRSTIEFRIMDYEACKNSEIIRNWIKLIIHFVEISISKGLPEGLNGDKWSSYLWLDPVDVFEFLRFNSDLCEELKETRDWFLNRLLRYTGSNLCGIMSDKARSYARKELEILR